MFGHKDRGVSLAVRWTAAVVTVAAMVMPAAAFGEHSVTELISVPSNGAGPAAVMTAAAASPDGNHVARWTTERLDPADTDTQAVWELGQVRVFDGGPDGDADTAGDNTLFMTQRVFVP